MSDKEESQEVADPPAAKVEEIMDDKCDTSRKSGDNHDQETSQDLDNKDEQDNQENEANQESQNDQNDQEDLVLRFIFS